MYRSRSVMTVPDPSSAGLITISTRFRNFLIVLRSAFGRLSQIGLVLKT